MNKTTDIERFSNVLAVLKALFDKELSPPAEDAYYAAIEDMSIEEVERAARYAMQSCKFFPKPVELREFVRGSADDTAMKAWTDLNHAFQKAGFWTSVLFEDGAIAAAIEYVWGTWSLASEQLHTLSPEMLRAKLKEFCEAYRRAVREGKTAPKYLRGFCEVNNLETVGKWERGKPETIDGKTIYKQVVFVQGFVGGRSVEAAFDFFSGALVTPIEELVERPPIRALPRRADVRLLSAADEPMIPTEAAKELVNDLINELAEKFTPSYLRSTPSEEEWEARRQELKRQADELLGNG